MLIFSCEDSKVVSNCRTTIDKRLLNPTKKKKKIPHVQSQRRSPSKMLGWAKMCLESNPILAKNALKAQTKSWAHQKKKW